MESIPLPSLRYLRIFETVAQLESVSRASVAIHLSQPAVTQAMAKLEEEVGATLFERRHTGTYLTEEGGIFRRRTQRLFVQIEEALREFGVGSDNSRTSVLGAEAAKITRTQIRTFGAIARSGSLAQAAKSIGISQTSLHRAIRDLESQFGRPLYRHTAHGIIATKAGAELARHMMLAIREIEWAMDELRAARGAAGGRIAIGAQLLGSSFLIGAVANRFIKRFPEARVQIINDNYDSLLNHLRTGNIDYIVGLMRDPAPAPDLIEEPLFSDPYVVVARKGHPLARQRSITLADLARYDWVAPARGAARRATFDRLFTSMPVPPRTTIETSSLTAMRTILSESDHVTLLTRYEVSFEERIGLLTALRYEPLAPSASLGVTTRANWLPTESQVGFLKLLRESARMLHDSAVPATKSEDRAVALAS